MRLDKLLCDMNIGTRNEMKEYIKKGRVRVNEQIIKKPDTKVNEYCDQIYLDGVLLLFSKYQYYLLHKPAGYVTATKDNLHPTVMELLGEVAGKNLAPVGRLDKDTEGFLLITNDGELSHRLLSPKKHVPKTYYAKIEKPLSEKDLEQLQLGVDIGEEKLTKPAKVEILSELEIHLTIIEGKFHQVKRMLHAVDNEVIYLKRISMGGLQLPEDLECGEYMILESKDVAVLENID
ncbi:MAG: pseudouridine synthase [Eubacteriales bacterium]